MEIENYVSEFRTLQQKGCVRVDDTIPQMVKAP